MRIQITEQQLIRLNRRIISEQIDSDDEEKDLMQLWYGDDEDEYRDDYSFEKPYDNYRDDSDIESDDYYDLKNKERVDNTMRRNIELGRGSETDNERRKGYTIDGHEYFLTPIEYRRKLKDMGRISPEKAFTYDLDVDDDGKMVVKDTSKVEIKKLKYKIRNVMNNVESTEEYLRKNRDTIKYGSHNDRQNYSNREYSLKYYNNELNDLLAQYDELTGDINGENSDF
jgi:hypothetical protein